MSENNKQIIKLYVADLSTDTQDAILSIKEAVSFFSEQQNKPFQLEVVDIFEQPEIADIDNIIVTPTITIDGFSKNIILNFDNKEGLLKKVNGLLKDGSQV